MNAVERWKDGWSGVEVEVWRAGDVQHEQPRLLGGLPPMVLVPAPPQPPPAINQQQGWRGQTEEPTQPAQ
ncbi:hypothetical protein NQZ68_002655 [Dissostichus eleginoides]|nr:hypothetical protein NQZ68_002655 [Dissostichus eleginoides]